MVFYPHHVFCSAFVPFSSGSVRLCRLWTPPERAPAPVRPPAPAAPPPPRSPAPPRCQPPAHTSARCRRCRTTRLCRCRCTTSRLTTAASSGSAWTWRTATCTRASWWVHVLNRLVLENNEHKISQSPCYQLQPAKFCLNEVSKH